MEVGGGGRGFAAGIEISGGRAVDWDFVEWSLVRPEALSMGLVAEWGTRVDWIMNLVDMRVLNEFPFVMVLMEGIYLNRQNFFWRIRDRWRLEIAVEAVWE